jgi:CheY-specific phosphatase CheX
MNEQSVKRIESFMESAVAELFRSCGLEAARKDDPPPALERPLVATIGFTAPKIHGFLILSLDRELVAASLPENLRGSAAKESIVADWAGELSNQLLGRLKNRFHAVGVDIALSTPLVFVGKEMHYFAHCSLRKSIGFSVSGLGDCVAELQGDCPPEFEVGEAKASDGSAAGEGEVLLF